VKSVRELPASGCLPAAIAVTEGTFDFSAILSFMYAIHQSSDFHPED
jgi:hypothetical protein